MALCQDSKLRGVFTANVRSSNRASLSSSLQIVVSGPHCVDHAPLRDHTGTRPGARMHRSDGMEALLFCAHFQKWGLAFTL